jgi:hypothetical protein
MPQRIYCLCSYPLMPFHAEVLIEGRTNAGLQAQENKQEAKWTFSSCTAIGISLSHDERTLSQSDSRPVVGASSGAYAVDSSQCKHYETRSRTVAKYSNQNEPGRTVRRYRGGGR